MTETRKTIADIAQDQANEQQAAVRAIQNADIIINALRDNLEGVNIFENNDRAELFNIAAPRFALGIDGAGDAEFIQFMNGDIAQSMVDHINTVATIMGEKLTVDKIKYLDMDRNVSIGAEFSIFSLYGIYNHDTKEISWKRKNYVPVSTLEAIITLPSTGFCYAFTSVLPYSNLLLTCILALATTFIVIAPIALLYCAANNNLLFTDPLLATIGAGILGLTLLRELAYKNGSFMREVMVDSMHLNSDNRYLESQVKLINNCLEKATSFVQYITGKDSTGVELG